MKASHILTAMDHKLRHSNLVPSTKLKVLKMLREAIREVPQYDVAMDIIEPETVIDRVCAATGITRKQLKSRKRDREICAARQLTQYMLRWECGKWISFKNIAIMFGQDHSSVIHNCRSVTRYLENNDSLMVEYYNKYKAIV